MPSREKIDRGVLGGTDCTKTADTHTHRQTDNLLTAAVHDIPANPNRLKSDRMAANADVVLRKYHPGTDKTATVEQLTARFVGAGYGPTRAKKWIAWFVKYGILKTTGEKNEKGELLLTCLWW